LIDFERLKPSQALPKPSQTLSKSLSNSLKTSQTQAKSSILAGLGWIHGGHLQKDSKKLQKDSKKLQIFKKPIPSPQISLARVSGSAVLASRSSSNGSTSHPVDSGYLQNRQAKGTGNGVCWDGN